MRGRSDPGAGGRLLALLIALAVLAAGPAPAQEESDERRTAIWDGVAANAERNIANPDTGTEALESLRARLVRQRGEALEAEKALQPAVRELEDQLQALGPPPAEPATDAPEIAARRAELQEQIAAAQVPVLEAQEAYRRADELIGEIDGIVRARFSAELMSRGPSPVRPGAWGDAALEAGDRLAADGAALASGFADAQTRATVLRRLPANLMLIGAGLAVFFVLRPRLVAWIEGRLAVSRRRRTAAWVMTLRNLTRLVMPALGAGLFFAGLHLDGLLGRGAPSLFWLPPFVVVLIVAGWLAGSLLAPRHAAFRLVPLDDAEAMRGVRLMMTLGLAVALALLVQSLAVRWQLSPATQSVLVFPPILFCSAALWRVAGLMATSRLRLAAPPAGERGDSATMTIGLRFALPLIRLIRIVAVLAPLLAILGYVAAASFLSFRAALMVGLIAGVRVLFELLNKAAQAIFGAPDAAASDEDGGLIPVLVGAIVGIAALPLLAIIWGARPSDIADVWARMREGVTFGGITLSAGGVVTLILVLAIGTGLTRLTQTILRGTVLPRTRLDAGGRNAVLAAVGYVGFGASALAGIAAAGLDLSSLAIVAGALSVGIGFGLQNVVSNFVSGIILLIERPVKEGDWIEVGGFSGYVRGINVRSTEIETFDRASVILPNSDLIAGTVLNRTHVGTSGRVQVPVSVTYDADPRRVEAILMEIAESHPLVLEDPAPRVLFLDLGPDSMNFELRCWLRDVNFSLSARSDMNFDIVERFKAEDIRAHFWGRDLPPEPPAPSADREPLPPPEAGAAPVPDREPMPAPEDEAAPDRGPMPAPEEELAPARQARKPA